LIIYRTGIEFKNTSGKVKCCFSSNGHILLGTNIQEKRSRKKIQEKRSGKDSGKKIQEKRFRKKDSEKVLVFNLFPDYFILFYFILFYFILFYLILFYLILFIGSSEKNNHFPCLE
jgi:fatty-acid desaturase